MKFVIKQGTWKGKPWIIEDEEAEIQAYDYGERDSIKDFKDKLGLDFYQVLEFQELLQKNKAKIYRSNDYDYRFYFKKREQAEKVLEWLEAKILMHKMVNGNV